MGFQSIIAPGNDGILQFDLKEVGKLYPSGGLHYGFSRKKGAKIQHSGISGATTDDC